MHSLAFAAACCTRSPSLPRGLRCAAPVRQLASLLCISADPSFPALSTLSLFVLCFSFSSAMAACVEARPPPRPGAPPLLSPSQALPSHPPRPPPSQSAARCSQLRPCAAATTGTRHGRQHAWSSRPGRCSLLPTEPRARHGRGWPRPRPAVLFRRLRSSASRIFDASRPAPAVPLLCFA